jgi:hypothetical protein
MTYPAITLDLFQSTEVPLVLTGPGQLVTTVAWQAVGVPASVLFDRGPTIDATGYHGGLGVTEPE